MDGSSPETDDSQLGTVIETPAGLSANPPPSFANPPTSLDRYVVLEQIGHGGMGRVFRAYDPQLEREVALKLLRSDMLDADAQARLAREARAMARLSHPNVVPVYDARDGPMGVTVVMELVRGSTLRQWVEATSRPWSEVVARFVEAGRGLAAAHEAGLTHRDFKPGNVLVPAHGAAKVTDFGLAKPGPTLDSTGATSHASAHDTEGEPLTEVGVVMGTPRYMAPEQHAGQPTTPAVDQYALCVALWEALTGSPPFTGPHHLLVAAKNDGPPAWPGSTAVPRAVVSALRRGLAVEPTQRWPSVNALLDALTPDRSRRRWGLTAGGALVALALGAGAYGWTVDREQRCAGARSQLSGIWDDGRAAEVETALLNTGSPSAPSAWTWTKAELDAHADAWTAMVTDACEATTIRGEQSVETRDRRMACLQRARQQLAATVGVLVTADEEVVARAHSVVGGLEPLDHCADVAALWAEVEPPATRDAVTVEVIVDRLTQSKALRDAGRYEHARTTTEQARVDLDAVSYGPVETEVLLEEGAILEGLDQLEDADAKYRAALASALRWEQRVLASRAANDLLFVVGERRGLVDEAQRYRSLAEGLAATDDGARARLHSTLGHLHTRSGEHAAAEAEYRRALERWTEARDADHPAVIAARGDLGHALLAQQRFEDAEAELRQVLRGREAVLGPEHALVAEAVEDLGTALHAQGKLLRGRSAAAVRQWLEAHP